MTGLVLLDVTRVVSRRLKGATPTGIDRVCDAYAAHFAGKALAVLQLRGRGIILNKSASDRLFSLLDRPANAFRLSVAALLTKLPWTTADNEETQGALYLNVGHSDFDLDAHWRFIDKHALRPVYLLHDLIPLTHPEVTTRHKVARHRGRVIGALQNATGLVVTSNTVANDLRDFADESKLALPPLLTAPIAGSTLPIPLHGGNIDDHTFVSVGTIETRKNHAVLLRAWSLLIERLGDKAPRLVLAGSLGFGAEAVREALRQDTRLRHFVEIRSGLNDTELACLMVSARAVLLPTLAEGYGLPMVEALQMGVPVIASDLPSFREIGQGIPTLLDPASEDAWAEAVSGFCSDGAEHRRQITALSNFSEPTWGNHFSALDNWVEYFAEVGQTRGSDRLDKDSAVTQRPDRELQC